MTEYVIRRVLWALLTVWLVTMIVFFGLRWVVPMFYGDVVDVLTAQSTIYDAEREEQLREQYGLNKPVVEQYGEWAGDLARGNLGESLFSGRSVWSEMKDRLPVSVELGLIGILSSIFVAVPLGAVAALYQDRWPDYVVRTISIGLTSVPGFWLAILIITFGSIWFNWAPPLQFEYIQDDPIQHFKIMLMPGLLIGLATLGGLVRVMRSQMLEVLREDYIRTARAKGVHGRNVLMRHALRNALIPVVTIIGLELPILIAGTAIYEAIFVLPGMGAYIITAISNLDYPVVQGINVVLAIVIVASTLLVDLSYGLIDPRIRYAA